MAELDFEEIHGLALRLCSAPPFSAENIYVDLLLTAAVSEIQSSFPFVLKGGTALKAWRAPYRFSYDLDFSLFGRGGARKHYRGYQQGLEKLVSGLGFGIANAESDKHREGGRIFILKAMEGHLRIPIKLSVSSMDAAPCHEPVERKFGPVVKIPSKFALICPGAYRAVAGVSVKTLALGELCAEKVRALATRGVGGEWTPLLRDIVDLHVMDKNGVLDKVLDEGKCLKMKFDAVRGTGYWKKFEAFLSDEQEITVDEENLSIFFYPKAIDEKDAVAIVGKIRGRLQEILGER